MRPLNASVKHFLVQKLRLSNKEVIAMVAEGRVRVNGKPASLQQSLLPEDELTLDGQQIKAPEKFIYLAYYKPRGIETTLNPDIPDNMAAALNLSERVYPVGRLDKESEGLVLLTNDGKIFNKILHSNEHQEKEYVVTVNKPLTEEAVFQLKSGIIIMGQQTRPAHVKLLDPVTFQIILTQGLNRQIRRMCYKLGYEVKQLKRIRIVNLTLGNLKPGEWRNLSEKEILLLKKQVGMA